MSMLRFFNLLFFLFLMLAVWSQEKDSVVEIKIPTSYGDFVFKSYHLSAHSEGYSGSWHLTKLDEAIEKEAELKKILKDKVIVKLEVSPKGELLSYSLYKPGKLESFNVFAIKLMDELIQNAKDQKVALGSYFGEDGTKLIPIHFSIN